ncbi:hypothetical protein [Hyphobacterium sp.]|jgi:hypothetical protein|uniref:hypothetical protein n=1 Tax=Hyphobacterium sp. TaxID=2004662 RepID=UPI003BAB321B
MRDWHDGGEAANSRHFFSRKTMRFANAYRDVKWRRLGVQALISLILMSAPLSSWLGELGSLSLLIGAGLGGLTGYVALAKLLDAARRH